MAGFGTLIVKEASLVSLRSGVQLDYHGFLRISFGLVETLPVILTWTLGNGCPDGEFHVGFGYDEAGIEVVRECFIGR